ncbi:MAG: hypothetical protein ACE5OP_13945 [Candidatus Glassbacteria bacterium]
MKTRSIGSKAIALTDFGKALAAVSFIAALYAASLAVFMSYIGQSM